MLRKLKFYPPSQKTTGVNPWMNALCVFRKGIVNIGSMFCFGGFRPEGIKRYHGCPSTSSFGKWFDKLTMSRTMPSEVEALRTWPERSRRPSLRMVRRMLSLSNHKAVGLHILFLLVLSFFAFGCVRKEEVKDTGPQTIPVKVAKVELKDLNKVLEYVGNIRAQDEVMVYPKVSGKIIQKVKEEGAQVNKGDVIAYIDRDEVGLKFEKAPVETPLAGVVGRVYVDIGSNVSSQIPVAFVVNMDKVKINLDLPEKYLPKVYLGQEARITVDAYPQDEFIGKVTKVSPVVNLENRAAPVEITIDNQGHKLKSGMFAKVGLSIEQHKNVPVILKEAIIGKEPDTYVYIIENNKAVLKKITLGLRQAEFYEVLEGIKEGDQVVIMGQQRLSEGVAVTVEMNNELK